MNEISIYELLKMPNPNIIDIKESLNLQLDIQLWVFGDGSTSSNFNPIHVYPATGGKYTATLKASIGGGKCEEVKTFEFGYLLYI